MPLPKQVQEGLEEADRIQQGLQASPKALEAAMNAPQSDQNAANLQVVPSEPAQTPPQEPQTSPQQPSDDAALWKQRYESHQGQFQAGIRRLNETTRTVEALTQRMDEFGKAMQDIRQLLESRPTASEPEEPASRVTDADVEAFGADMIDLQGRVAQTAVQKAFSQERKIWQKKLDAQQQVIDQLRAQQENVVTRTQASEQSRFMTRLAELVPDYRQTNEDVEFLEWLREIDPMSGYPRQKLLDFAQESANADQAAAIFKAFGQTKASAPANAQLKNQVSPPKSRQPAAQPAGTPGKKVWSNSEIDAFYKAQMHGQIDPAEAERIEREIHSAMLEGRVK